MYLVFASSGLRDTETQLSFEQDSSVSIKKTNGRIMKIKCSDVLRKRNHLSAFSSFEYIIAS